MYVRTYMRYAQSDLVARGRADYHSFLEHSTNLSSVNARVSKKKHKNEGDSCVRRQVRPCLLLAGQRNGTVHQRAGQTTRGRGRSSREYFIIIFYNTPQTFCLWDSSFLRVWGKGWMGTVLAVAVMARRLLVLSTNTNLWILFCTHSGRWWYRITIAWHSWLPQYVLPTLLCIIRKWTSMLSDFFWWVTVSWFDHALVY